MFITGEKTALYAKSRTSFPKAEMQFQKIFELCQLNYA